MNDAINNMGNEITLYGDSITTCIPKGINWEAIGYAKKIKPDFPITDDLIDFLRLYEHFPR